MPFPPPIQPPSDSIALALSTRGASRLERTAPGSGGEFRPALDDAMHGARRAARDERPLATTAREDRSNARDRAQELREDDDALGRTRRTDRDEPTNADFSIEESGRGRESESPTPSATVPSTERTTDEEAATTSTAADGNDSSESGVSIAADDGATGTAAGETINGIATPAAGDRGVGETGGRVVGTTGGSTGGAPGGAASGGHSLTSNGAAPLGETDSPAATAGRGETAAARQQASPDGGATTNPNERPVAASTEVPAGSSTASGRESGERGGRSRADTTDSTRIAIDAGRVPEAATAHAGATIARADSRTRTGDDRRANVSGDAPRSGEGPDAALARLASLLDGEATARSNASGGAPADPAIARATQVQQALVAESIGLARTDGDAAATRGAFAGVDAEIEPSPAARLAARGLGMLAAQKGGRMTMRLDPPHLGELRIVMTVIDGAVDAELQATTRSAQAMIERSLGSLRQSLEQQGLSIERLHATTTAGARADGDRTGDSTSNGSGSDRAREDRHDASDQRSRGRRDDADGDHRGRRRAPAHDAFASVMDET